MSISEIKALNDSYVEISGTNGEKVTVHGGYDNMQILYYVVLIAAMYFITMLIMRRITGGSGGIMNVGKSVFFLHERIFSKIDR